MTLDIASHHISPVNIISKPHVQGRYICQIFITGCILKDYPTASKITYQHCLFFNAETWYFVPLRKILYKLTNAVRIKSNLFLHHLLSLFFYKKYHLLLWPKKSQTIYGFTRSEPEIVLILTLFQRSCAVHADLKLRIPPFCVLMITLCSMIPYRNDLFKNNTVIYRCWFLHLFSVNTIFLYT